MFKSLKNKLKSSSSTKVIINMGVINFVLSIVVSMIIYWAIYNSVVENLGARAYDSAATLAKLIDIDKVKKYKENPVVDDEYRNIVKKLDAFKVSMGLMYLYVESWDEQGNRFIIYDATEPGDGVEDSAYGREEPLGARLESSDYANQFIINSDNIALYEVENNFYGHTVASHYPLKDENGKNFALVGADISFSEIVSQIRKNILFLLLLVQIIIILVTLAIIYILRRNIYSPLRKISNFAKNFVNKKHDKINVNLIKYDQNDEIGSLVDSFNKMMLDIKKYSEHIREVVAEKEYISAELNIATQIQHSLIPHIFPAFPELEEMDIYAVMNPAKKIGGDFYDFFLIDNHRLAFVIADVSGKGIPAALLMVITKTLIKKEATLNDDPGIIFKNVNDQMCDDSSNSLGMFITTFMGILDLRTGEVNFSNAGHNNPLIKKRNGKFNKLRMEKQFVIAGMPNLDFKTEKFQMNAGDIIFLYTDGITEAEGANSKFLGEENLISILDSIDAEKSSLKQISNIVLDKVKEFREDSPQNDDATILVIRYNGKN